MSNYCPSKNSKCGGTKYEPEKWEQKVYQTRNQTMQAKEHASGWVM